MDLKNKDEYRKFAKAKRSKIDMILISQKICNNIANQDFYKYSDNILGFFPMGSEVDLRSLYEDNSKNWFLPRVDNLTRGLIINRYKSGDTLIKSQWGVFEPSENRESIDIKKIDITIIPALMVDNNGFRLGYGAGFYDRFIPGLRKDCLKIVPLPQELLIDSLPHDHWDIPVNKIITQNSLIKI